MSSSRSIAAARARRSGEQQPPISGMRPGQSIATQAAFAQQPQYQQQPNNVRIARAPIQQQQQQQQVQQQQPVQNPNGLPFTKLTVSDAIGLITLRLGKVEQFIIDLENGQHTIGSNTTSTIPENSKIIDNSVLTTIINRLDSLEKRETPVFNLDQINSLEKELKETKQLLTSFMLKFDLYAKETNDKFTDIDFAISDLENNINLNQTNVVDTNNENNDTENEIVDLESNIVDDSNNTNIISSDLKQMIKEEFSN
jgi:hypothetical protein